VAAIPSLTAEVSEHSPVDNFAGVTVRIFSLAECVSSDMLRGIESGAEDDISGVVASILSLTQPVSSGVWRPNDSGAEENAAIVSCVHV